MDKLEIKADLGVDDAGVITGIAWPFHSADRAGDSILPGAFSLGVDQVPMLLKHNPEEPIGLWESIEETAQGLEVKGRLFIDESRRARAVHSMLRSKQLTGLSIGFKTKAAQRISPRQRTISALDLYEISVVRTPQHPGARLMSVKTATDVLRLAEAINRAASAFRT